jgi:hypothetical protein
LSLVHLYLKRLSVSNTIIYTSNDFPENKFVS